MKNLPIKQAFENYANFGQYAELSFEGNATLVAGTVTIANTGVNANTRVYTSLKTIGGTLGVHYQYDILAGTSVTINSINAAGSIETGDTSVISYIILN